MVIYNKKHIVELFMLHFKIDGLIAFDERLYVAL